MCDTVPLCMVQGRTSSAGVICNRSAIFRIPGLDPTTMLLGIYSLAQQSRSLLTMRSSDDLQCCSAAFGTLRGWERALCESWTAPKSCHMMSVFKVSCSTFKHSSRHHMTKDARCVTPSTPHIYSKCFMEQPLHLNSHSSNCSRTQLCEARQTCKQ